MGKDELGLRIIGVTGGIGSGKSTVSGILQQLGAMVIDADIIAREIVKKGEKAFQQLVDYFGLQILGTDGELDRRRLAELAFNDREKLDALNSITHKYVSESIIKRVEAARLEDNAGTVVLDVPIPVEHGFLDVVDEVWVVTADMDVRIKRVMERSGFTYQEVYDRVQSQKRTQDYLSIANRVIFNNGGLEGLQEQVMELYNTPGDIIA